MSVHIRIDFIPEEDLLSIVPFIHELNEGTVAIEVLEERTREMMTQNWKCIGLWEGDELIGVCGLWMCTRHYSGRSLEADHVYIRPDFQGRGLGKKLFEWIEQYAMDNQIEAVELNTYVRNTRSHKFYHALDYEILGFHFVKKLV